MEQNVQVLDEHCQHGITIKHVWQNVKTLSFRGPSLDGEPHAETTFLSQSFEHGKMIHDMFTIAELSLIHI